MNRIEIISELPNRVYHGEYKEYISSTVLKKLKEGGLRYKWEISQPYVEKPHFVFGSLWHDLISSNHHSGIPVEDIYAIVDYPEYMLNKGKPYGETSQAYVDGYNRLKSEHDGKQVIFLPMYEKAKEMVAQIFTPTWKHPSEKLFKAMFEKGEPEVSYFIRDFIPDVNIKFRPDLDGETFFIDYKTTSGLISDFERDIQNYGYDISAAFYREGKNEVNREMFNHEKNIKMFWLVQEVNPPYDWAMFCADELIEDATAKFYDLLSYYHALNQTEYGGIASLSTDKHGVFFPKTPSWNKKFNKLQL